VTLAEVARMCDVSSATASRALRGLPGASDELRSKIEQAARSVGYRPNRTAQALRSRRSQIVGLVVTNLVNASFQLMIEVAQLRLHEQGYDMIVAISGGDAEQEQRFVNMLLDRQVDGILMLGSSSASQLAPSLKAPPVPVVHVLRRLEPQPADTLFADDRHGAFEATSYLLSLGHRRIGLIVGKRGTQSGSERLGGYRAALAAFGVRSDRRMVHEGRFNPATGAAGVAHLLSLADRPTALLIANHEAAFGALPALAERGVDLPAQLSLVVYEDAPLFVHWSPPLTVVDNDPSALAESAVDLLLSRLGSGFPGAVGGEGAVVPSRSRLVVRSSCAPVH
jgi:LacI family transcriptional regulator